MRDFHQQSDRGGQWSPTLYFSDYVCNYVLEAGVEKVVAIPEGAGVAVFNTNGLIYVKTSPGVTVPVSDVIDGTGGEMNPNARKFDSGETAMYMISPENCIVSISYYAR